MKTLFAVVFLLLLSGCGDSNRIKWCEYLPGDRVSMKVGNRFERATVQHSTAYDRACWYELKFDDKHIQPNVVIVNERHIR